MFAVLIIIKLFKIKIIHWGHRRPVGNRIRLKSIIYNVEHWLDDAVILYSEQLRDYVWKQLHDKVFIANNTLNLSEYDKYIVPEDCLKRKYHIRTKKNIICMGRMQKRKRIMDLVKAFRLLSIDNTGLILAGPDDENMLENISDKNIFKLGPIYGKDSIDLLLASDIYCLPGAIGLSIVDAFFCSLPVLTEDVMHGPEIMYLKNGVNGFIVPKGDIQKLAEKLNLLLSDDSFRKKLGQAAKTEINTHGHIDRLCEGFNNAINYVLHKT